MSKLEDCSRRVNDIIKWYNYNSSQVIDRNTGKIKDLEQFSKFQLTLAKNLLELQTFVLPAIAEAVVTRTDIEPEIVLPRGVKLHQALRSKEV